MKLLKIVVSALLIIGALNWGLWGFFQFDIVAWAFGGDTSTLSRAIYGIIGLAGLCKLACICRCCKSGCGCGCSSCSNCSGGSCGTKGGKGGGSGCCR